jgi:hypothetical protein
MFACRSRTNTWIWTKLGMLIPWNQEEILERSELRESVLGSEPGGCDFCTLETKHNRKTSPRPKLFVSARNYRFNGNPPLRKTVLGSSLGEYVFCSSKTKHDRRTAQRTELFVSARRLQELKSQTRKLSWVRFLVRMLGLWMMIIFCDIQWYVSNDQACGRLSCNKS